MWGAIASAVSGLASSAGSLWQNHQNRKHQDTINNQLIDLANTAHQREVADLKAAGLNPVLSADGNGSSVPQLTPPNINNPGEGVGQGISSAAKYVNSSYRQQVKQAAATTANIEAQTGKVESERALLEAQTGKIAYETALMNAQLEKVHAETSAIGYQNALRDVQAQNEEIRTGILEIEKQMKHDGLAPYQNKKLNEYVDSLIEHEILTGERLLETDDFFKLTNPEFKRYLDARIRSRRASLEHDIYMHDVDRQKRLDIIYSAGNFLDIIKKFIPSKVEHNHKRSK